MNKIFVNIWSNWRIGLAIVAGISAVAGMISAWLTPRGPITTSQALISMVAALIIGIFTGFVMGNRWSIVIAPITFLITFEIARLGVVGATVDSIHLGSLYGILAFVLGRVIPGVLVLLPMMLGATLGTDIAARFGAGNTTPQGTGSWIFTGLLALGLIVLGIAIARPGRTSPVIGQDGEPLPGSIAEIISVLIGDHQQTIMVRGRDVDNPVMLYLAGGPGGTDLGAMRADVGLEQDFVVVTWEQRGVGKSYSALDPVETLTLDQMVADTVELTDYLRERFDEEKIYLVGNSWGTILGALAVKDHPKLYHAFIGTGQMVSPRETDIMFYEDTLAWAKETGNDELVSELEKNGLPPYQNLLDYEPANSHEHDWNPYPELDMSKEMPAILFVPENTMMDKINGFRSFFDTFSILYPQIQELDFRSDITKFDIPYYMVIGAHEARGRAVLANEWFQMLDAPIKERVVFEHSGHRPLFEEPSTFAALMADILKETYP